MRFWPEAWETCATRRAAAATAALALQGLFFWLILQQTIAPKAPSRVKPFEVAIVVASRPRPASLPPVRRNAQSRAPAANEDHPMRSALMRPARALRVSNGAPQNRFDWRRALRSEVRSQASRAGSKGLQFGFPRQPEAAPAPLKFGWDFARTHRVQALPEGGIVINLTDRCAVVLVGLMVVPGCEIGRMAANGHLFDHMYGRKYDRPGALP